MRVPRRSFPVNSAAGIILAASALGWAQTRATTGAKTGYAAVNGLNLYYEVHGAGQPLIVLHGGLGSTQMFDDILPALSKGRQVVAVDLQAHGRTADVARPMTYEPMADDIAALIQHLAIGKPDVLGYSLGGGVALRTVIQHPENVRKLVLVSTPFARDGWYPEVLAGMSQMGTAAAEQLKQSPLYQLYARVAPEAGRLACIDYQGGRSAQEEL